MLKYAHAQIMTKALAPTDASARELRRFAHRHHFDYEVRPGYLYVRSRAISSRCNDNFDEFPAEELEKAYASFKGKPVFVNHHNDDHKRARGVIIDAALHKDSNRDGTKDYWVEVLMEVDALRFPKLASEIMNGNIARTSMGCDVAFSVCSACGNKATTPAEYCAHIPASKGMTLYRATAAGHKVGEIIRETCYGLKFFENSLLVEPPADPTAFFLGVDTRGLKMASRSRQPGPGQGELFDASPMHREPAPQKRGSADGWTEGESQSWDSIGERHPHVYGDPEIHEGAEGDGEGIGWAANHLAHATPEDPDAENNGVHDLIFHSEHVDPYTIDHARHGSGDRRVQYATEGYRSNPDQVPPLVLVHRHGVYQVADGHHRAEGAKLAGQKSVRAYVAYSPHPNKPSSDGDKAPYHGAEEHPGQQPQWEKDFQAKYASRLTLAELMAEGINQEGGELPAFPWDKAPKINLPMTQKGWDDPRRKQLYDARGERDVQGPAPAGPYQSLIDKLPDHATQELTNPHGMGVADVGREHRSRDSYPGDKREQWARQRWDNVKWPTWTSHNERPSTPTEQAASKRNIRTRWSKTWKRPLACDHPGCPPWEHEGDPMRPTEPKPSGASGITMADGHPLDPFEQFLKGPEDGTAKEAAAATPPEDHPWFAATGISHHHIVDHWDASTSEEKAQGKRWYPDAHLVAKSIAKLHPGITDDKEAAHKGAGVLSAYSPQAGWWANQHNAARSFHEQRALGKGEGIMIMSSHATAAQKILDGQPHHEALKGPKTQDFASLIEHGGYKPQSEEDAKAGKPREHSDKVVVDRHALSVAAGRRLNADDVKGFPSQSRKHYEVVANHYRKAAAVISDREGREVPPHEVQAVTWLARQRLNAEGDASPGQKGRNTVQRNQRTKWQDLSREHTPELHEPPANSHVAGANGDLPELTFHHRDRGDSHVVEAHDGEGNWVGQMSWYKHSRPGPKNGYCQSCDEDAETGSHKHPAGEVDGIEVDPDYQRRGVATALWNHANSLGVTPKPKHSPNQTGDGRAWAERVGSKVAFGEQKAPADVDTLREDACPVCGDRDTFDGATCQVCGYVAPPKMFQDPDLEKARQMDLRKDIAEFNDPANPNQLGPDGQPIDPQQQAGGPMDPGELDENGNPINPDAADPGAQPGSLPGEVQAEVQPGGDPMGGGSPLDPGALGPDGMPLDPNAAPVDPAMLGPDGQPLQQPGQQMMVGPDGMPIGPQALPADAVTKDGQPFTPGPNMPQGPGGPEAPVGPEAPLNPDEMGPEGQVPTDGTSDGQIPNPDAGQGVPGTPGDGVPDLQCPACGFTADATNPVSVDMDASIMPPDGQATPDGVQAGDVCPNCGAGQLMSPAEMQGETSLPVPM